MGPETDKLIADKENVLRSMENEMEQHVVKHVHFDGQAKGNSTLSEWFLSDDSRPSKIVENEEPSQVDKKIY